LADRLEHTFERRLRLDWARLRHDRYVVRNDVTGHIVQVSNRLNPHWKTPVRETC
jgi:hypothetical protein